MKNPKFVYERARVCVCTMSSTAEIDTDDLNRVAAKLKEPNDSKTIEEGMRKAPNAMLVCNILVSVLMAQRWRNVKAPSLQHRLRYAPGEDRIVLSVEHVAAMDRANIEAIKALSPRVLGMRFQFTSPEHDDALTSGLVIFDLLHTGAQRKPVVPAYMAPARRRTRTTPVDWKDSVVLECDREFVLRVVDDVYNMHQLMPAKMNMSVEAIEDADYARCVPAKRKHEDDTPLDDESENTSTRTHPALVGYCIHFVGVPSFDETFLDHMARKYATRWLGATVIFPRARWTTPPQLVVSISCENALLQSSAPRAVCGAKRLCKKIYGPQ